MASDKPEVPAELWKLSEGLRAKGPFLYTGRWSNFNPIVMGMFKAGFQRKSTAELISHALGPDGPRLSAPDVTKMITRNNKPHPKPRRTKLHVWTPERQAAEFRAEMELL